MINEGAKILEEGKAQRASDIDVVWINGYGWPVYRGGPMFYADLIGPEKVLTKLKQFEVTMGAEFKPAPLLEGVVAEKKRLQDLITPVAQHSAGQLHSLRFRRKLCALHCSIIVVPP